MKILHYSLGYPPNRSGGLVKYAIDLMNEEVKLNHEVFFLYPGRYNPFGKTRIQKEKTLNNGIHVFELLNSLPLPLFGGIRTPKDFYQKVSKKIYSDFLTVLNVDVIHVHTLMGLHKEFFIAAQSLNIPIVFTSHDYFGLAPEPNFFFQGKSYDTENTVNNWYFASQYALSTNKLRVFQLKRYYILRKLINLIKGKRSYNKKLVNEQMPIIDNNRWEELSILKNYYSDIFSLINKFHFNSSLAKEIYQNNIAKKDINYQVIPITNSSVSTKVANYKKNSNKVRIAYIGPDKEYKGFYEFIKLNEALEKDKFELNTYGYEVVKKINGINQHGKYKASEINNIYSNIDILIVPSLWKETFGLIVLEALSYNTLVFASENVGSKDLLSNDYIFTDQRDLLEKIRNYKKYKVAKLENKNCLKKHTSQIIDFYTS